jgi:hypothetical protein
LPPCDCAKSAGTAHAIAVPTTNARRVGAFRLRIDSSNLAICPCAGIVAHASSGNEVRGLVNGDRLANDCPRVRTHFQTARRLQGSASTLQTLFM